MTGESLPVNQKSSSAFRGEPRKVNGKNHRPALIPLRAVDAVVAEQIFGAVRIEGGPYFLYPDVAEGFMAGAHTPRSYSADIRAAFDILDRIHLRTRDGDKMWLFSKRMRFYEALERLCSLNELGHLLPVAWPAALGIFREDMPLFICLAALETVCALDLVVDPSRSIPNPPAND